MVFGTGAVLERCCRHEGYVAVFLAEFFAICKKSESAREITTKPIIKCSYSKVVLISLASCRTRLAYECRITLAEFGEKSKMN